MTPDIDYISQIFLIVTSQLFFHIFRTLEISWVAKGLFWKSIVVGWVMTVCFLFSTWVGVVSVNKLFLELNWQNVLAVFLFIVSVSIGRVIGMKIIKHEQ